MPNGGPDNCGSCDHFSNKGQPMSGICSLRGEEIQSPFWTYCANNSVYHHDESLPIGPIYQAKDGSTGYRRIPWKNAPDTPEIRQRIREIAQPWKNALDTPEIRQRLREIGLAVLDPNLLHPWVMHPGYNAITELVRLRDPEGRNILQILSDEFPEEYVGKMAAAELERWDQTDPNFPHLGLMHLEYNAIIEFLRSRDPESRNILQMLVDRFPEEYVGKIAAAELEKWDQSEQSES